MEKINLKIYLFVFFFLIFFFVLIILLPINKKNNDRNESKKKQSPIPTTTKIFPTKIIKNNPTSAVLLKPTSTGGGDEEPPKEEIKLAIKKQELQDKTPLIEESFMITFDYNTDKFIVSLQKPEDGAKKDFEQWREKHYPQIPLDRFIFQTD